MRILLLLLAVLPFACRGPQRYLAAHPRPVPRPAPAPVPPPPPPAKPEPPPIPTTPAPIQDEPEIRDFFKTWLAAQNSGDFESYQSLYADKFTGVRRSGPRTRSFDRKGWLADRQRMFRKPMKVALEDLRITSAGTAFNILATQTWESGRYKDTGPKRFLLVRQAGRLVLAQEEMLASQYHRLPPASGAYLLAYQGEPVVTDEAEEGWTQPGAPKLHGLTARRGVIESALPDRIRQWRGKQVVLFNDQGQRCQATVDGFAIVAGAIWHGGTVQQWREQPPSDQDLAEQIWHDGAHRLVLTLAFDPGTIATECEGAVVAIERSVAPPQAFPFKPLNDGPLFTLAKRSTRKLLLESVDGKEGELEGGEEHAVAYNEASMDRAFVFSNHHPHGCGQETGSASGLYFWLYEGKPRPRLSLIDQLHDEGEPNTPARLILAIDVDLDGELELVYGDAYGAVVGILKRAGGKLGIVRTVQVPNFDSPC